MRKTYLCTNVGDEAEAKAASGIWLKSMRTSLTCLLACAALSLVAACSDDGKSDGKGDVCADVTCSDHGTCEVKDDAAVCGCDEGYHVKEGDATTCEADEPGNPGDKTCTDACEANILRCSGGNRERCVPDDNQCPQWQTETCPENTHCDENSLQCVPNDSSDDPKTCTNSCELGSKRCIDNAIQACQTNENGCNIWKTEKQCGIQKCDESSHKCVSVCTDACTKGKNQCSGENIQECKVSSNGCTEWVTIENCADKNQVCNALDSKCRYSIDSFQIMYNQGIWAFELTKDDVDNIKKAGFTLVPLSNRTNPNKDDYDKYNEEMKNAIELLDKEGINVIVNDLTFQIIRWTKNWSESPTRPTKDQIVKQIEFYNQFNNVVGFDVRDEPNFDELDSKYSELIKLIRANSGEKEIYINLFPDYVNVNDCCSGSDYSTYLDRYVDALKNVQAKVLSIDYYPDNLKESSQDVINEKRNFYAALKSIREKAKNNNLIPMNISVSTEHNNFKNPFDMRDIAWQIASNIAHGMKRISYFTYWTLMDSPPTFVLTNMEMVDRTTKQPTKRYEEVKVINSILGSIGKEIYSKEIKEVTIMDSLCEKDSSDNSHLSYDPTAHHCIFADNTAVDVMVDVEDSNAIVTTFDDDITFLLTATSIENFKDSVFTFRWPSKTLQWYDYNSKSYKAVTDGVLDDRKLYSAEFQSTINGTEIVFHVKSGYALLLRK